MKRLDRRDFLRTASGAIAGLCLSVGCGACSEQLPSPPYQVEVDYGAGPRTYLTFHERFHRIDTAAAVIVPRNYDMTLLAVNQDGQWFARQVQAGLSVLIHAADQVALDSIALLFKSRSIDSSRYIQVTGERPVLLSILPINSFADDPDLLERQIIDFGAIN